MLKTGTVLEDKWVILESLGKGGMGEVFRAHQLNLNRDVAIKIVSQEWLETFDGDEQEIENALSRFRREVKATACIRHPNVVQIIDYGSTTLDMDGNEVPLEYIVMEYIPGATLRFTMSEEGFEPDENLVSSWLKDYFFPVLDGVEAIHASETVHRDLKPENVLMDGNVPKILDFGLAASSRLAPITGSVDVKGTAAYMSPEQFVDLKRTDVRTDIYALGKILYEAIAGKMPPTTIPFKTVSLDHPETPFSRKLDRIIRTATAERKEDRFDSVADFRAALKEALTETEKIRLEQTETSGRSVQSATQVKWIWIGIMVTLLAVSAMTVWHLTGEPGFFTVKDESSQVAVSESPNVVDSERPRAEIEKTPRMAVPASEAKRIPSEVEDRPESSAPTAETAKPSPVVEESTQASSPRYESLPQTLLGKDGSELHLIPGRTVIVPDGFGNRSGKPVELEPFYMSETLVTNHQYVEFLNEMLPRIEVKQGAVRGEGNLWLLLGEVVAGYEPIVFRDGKFHVTEVSHAFCPVVRVTPYGASAYAAFVGRRLPTDMEWLYAVKEGATEEKGASWENEPSVEESGTMSMMEQMHSRPRPAAPPSEGIPPFPSPVMLYPANAFGIRGLNRNVGEWGSRRGLPASGNEGVAAEYVVLGGMGKKPEQTPNYPSPVPRQPWEAFEEVGFRCVVTASKEQ